jgi:hypothetical protein
MPPDQHTNRRNIMPTGYTADIAEDITFNQYVWSCARAFGALVMMRDDPTGTPIPERFEPSDWSVKALAKAKDRLATLQAMSPEAIEANARQDYKDALARHAERKAEYQALRRKYEAMLAQVRAWTSPSKDHDGLKEFMEKQITESIDWDCNESHLAAPEVQSASVWLTEQIGAAERDIAYHTKAHAEEIERTENRNQWLKALRESVAQPT